MLRWLMVYVTVSICYAVGVGHFKTLAELSGPAGKLLSGLSPAQLSLVVEGLGKAGAKDEAFLAAAAAKVRKKLRAADSKSNQIETTALVMI